MGLGATAWPTRARAQAEAIADRDILQFALNLEYLEAEYYLLATTGQGLDAVDLGLDPGAVRGGRQVVFEIPAVAEFAAELAENEMAHVRFYHRVLGDKAVSRPAIDFDAGFAAVAQSAGLGNFDPFANDMSFLLGGMLFEEVSVTAYAGVMPLLQDKELVEATAGILAIEACHMGLVRSQLYQMGEEAWAAAQAISDARDAIDGDEDKDQGIILDGRANIAPSDAKGMAFRRRPRRLLRILYLTNQEGVSQGGFYPQGMNGNIKNT